MDSMSMSTTSLYNSPGSDSAQHATATENTLEMEARIRQMVVESRRKKKPSSENAPIAKSDLPCVESVSHHPPCDTVTAARHSDIVPTPPGKPSSQNTLSLLAAKQRRLEEEIARAKAQLERAKPKSKSTADRRMRRRELWPQTNPQALIFDISDDEEDETGAERTANQLRIITNCP